jgi:hypothetical protein
LAERWKMAQQVATKDAYIQQIIDGAKAHNLLRDLSDITPDEMRDWKPLPDAIVKAYKPGVARDALAGLALHKDVYGEMSRMFNFYVSPQAQAP